MYDFNNLVHLMWDSSFKQVSMTHVHTVKITKVINEMNLGSLHDFLVKHSNVEGSYGNR